MRVFGVKTDVTTCELAIAAFEEGGQWHLLTRLLGRMCQSSFTALKEQIFHNRQLQYLRAS